MITCMLFSKIATVNNLRNEKFMVAFGDNLKKLRLQKKLSREMLSAYSDVEVMQIYRIEKGIVNTTISTVYALAAGLKVHPKKLMDFDLPE